MVFCFLQVQKALPRECKQLHSKEAVFLKELKSKSLLLRCYMALLIEPQRCENLQAKNGLQNAGFCSIKIKQIDTKLAQVTILL